MFQEDFNKKFFENKYFNSIPMILSIVFSISYSNANLIPDSIKTSTHVTEHIIESNSASDGFSVQSVNSKIKLQEIYSGECADNVFLESRYEFW